jgi:probable HAF family extracellular repeat protein
MFMGLGDLPGSIFQSVAWAVSADGNVVVGDSRSGQSSPASPEAFRWENGMMVGLGDLPGALYESRSLAVSADGSVIVGRSDIGNGSTGVYEEAFRWTESDGMVGLGDLPGGLVISAARGVSADGSVIVGDSGIDGGTEAFRWTAATGMEGIGHLYDWGIHGNSSQAFAVSADGSVIVGGSTSESSGGSHYQAFRWTESEGMLGLGDLPGGIFESIARAVSADGSVIVGQTNANEAFRWTESGGMVGLGDLPGFAFYSVANAVSADGSIVVGVSQDDPTRYDTNDHAFIWDELNGIRNLKDVLTDKGLDLSEWELMSATGVSADGRTIVGHGVNPAGDYEGWIAYLGFP